MPEQNQSLTGPGGQPARRNFYTNPKVLIPAIGIGYLLLNKKTRKPALIFGGSALIYGAIRGEGWLNVLYYPGAIMLFLGLGSKK